MKVAIHQPQYLPWLPTLLKALESDLFVHLDSVAFQKNGLQNRNQIKTSQGPLWLTVPVKQKLGQAIKDVEIDNSANWRRKHWAAITQNYQKAPAYSSYAGELEKVYEREWKYLVDLNIHLMDMLMGWTGVRARVGRSSAMKAEGKASELVLNLCMEAGATTYLSGFGGRAYLDGKSFAAAGVSISYQPNELMLPYPQRHPGVGFVANLCSLDVLFNCGSDWPRYVRNQTVSHEAST